MKGINSPNEEMIKSFQRALNDNGYGFQYSVLNRAKNLFESGKSAWGFEAAEFPIEVKGKGSKIDFILKLKSSPFVFLLAECKRANPAYSTWFFARAPFVMRNREQNYSYIECVTHKQLSTIDFLESSVRKAVLDQDVYHIALAVKTGLKGTSTGDVKDAIEKALTQICLGLNGQVEFFKSHINMLETGASALFLPVLFTTAELWTTDVDLSQADINSGEIHIDTESVSKRPFILFQYNLSPGIKHEVVTNTWQSNNSIMENYYVRTVAIVNPTGIDEFLQWSSSIIDW
jgi:hypothetical protein